MVHRVITKTEVKYLNTRARKKKNKENAEEEFKLFLKITGNNSL